MTAKKASSVVRPEEKDDKNEAVEVPNRNVSRKSNESGWVKHHPHEIFSARLISKTDWASIGIDDQETVEWNEGNGFMLPKKFFSKDALNYLLNIDDGFSLVD